MGKKYFDIGKNGTTDQFLKAFKKGSGWDVNANLTDLIDGAAQALREGLPENIQTALLNAGASDFYAAQPLYVLLQLSEKSVDKVADITLALGKIPEQDRKEFLTKALGEAVKDNIGKEFIAGALREFSEGNVGSIQTALANIDKKTLESVFYPGLAASILFSVSQESDGGLAGINLALAKIPEQDKKEFLSNVLNDALNKGIGNESFFSALLEAGADANAKINGYAGNILVTATCSKATISVINLLHKNGASFDDALTTMHSRGLGTADIDRLKFYQEKTVGKPVVVTTGQPAAEDADMREILLQMQEQMLELTQEVKDLKSLVGASNANKPKKTQEKSPEVRPYISLKGPRQPKKTGAAPTL